MADATEAAPRPAASLFRASALAHAASPDQLNKAAGIVKPAAGIVLTVAAAVVATGVSASLWIAVPLKVPAEGILISPSGVRDVAAIMGGQIRDLRVRVGDRVEAGETVAELEQPDLQEEIASAQADLGQIRDQLDKTRAFDVRTAESNAGMRAQQRSGLQSAIAFDQQRIDWLADRLKNQQELADKGVVPRQALLQSRIDLGTARDDLSRSLNALTQVAVDDNAEHVAAEREILDLTIKLGAAERKVGLLQARLGRADAVTSPYTGVVAELKVNTGETVEHGTALMTVIPDVGASGGHDDAPLLVANLFVSPADGKKIRTGMEVQVLPSTTKVEEYGFILARITSVSAIPATREGMERLLKNNQVVSSLSANGAPFAVQAELIRAPDTTTGYRWSTSRGPDETLSVDSPCKAEIVTRTQTLFQLIMPAFRSFFGKFT